MCTRVPLQLLNQLTDFHKTSYEQYAVLGNSRTTFFNILRLVITIWCQAGAPLAFEVLRCCMIIDFKKNLQQSLPALYVRGKDRRGMEHV